MERQLFMSALVIDGNSKSFSVECCLETKMRRDVKLLYDVIADTSKVCSSLGPTRGSHTASALRARRDYKLTSLGAPRLASQGTTTITDVTFAILRDYLLYNYCFIVQFIHTKYFDCIYIIYFFFVDNFILLCPQLAVKTKYMDTLIKLLLTYLLTTMTRAYCRGKIKIGGRFYYPVLITTVFFLHCNADVSSFAVLHLSVAF